MKNRSEKSLRLYREMLKKGYPEEMCMAVSLELNTDFTAGRMLGYIANYRIKLPDEEIVDEMMAILSDRDAWIKKKESENAQAAYTEYLNSRVDDEDDGRIL